MLLQRDRCKNRCVPCNWHTFPCSLNVRYRRLRYSPAMHVLSQYTDRHTTALHQRDVYPTKLDTAVTHVKAAQFATGEGVQASP